MKHIDFFFDLSSPYSYLASTQIGAIASRHSATVAWKPFVLGAVLKTVGNAMPASVAPKAIYMLRDLELWAKSYNVPFQMNSRFPINAMKAHRLILAAERVSPLLAEKAACAAFELIWAEDRDITEPAELMKVARAVELGEDALQTIETPEIKARLHQYTDEALRRGVFGAPAIFVGERLFWGNDRLHFVEAALAGRL